MTYNISSPACTQALVFLHLGPAIPMIEEPIAPDYTLEAIISQVSPGGCHLHPNTVYPQGRPAKLSHGSYIKGPWAILGAFSHWLNFPEGATHTVRLPCDQFWGSEYRSECNHETWYHPGRPDTKPKALICHVDIYPWGDNTPTTILGLAALLVSYKPGFTMDSIAQMHFQRHWSCQP